MKKGKKEEFRAPKLCSVCGQVFYGRDATEGKTGPIICLTCYARMEVEKDMEREA